MFVVFHTLNLYVCEIMTCSTSYSLYNTLMDPLNVCIVYTYICMYVYVCVCVCVCVCMYQSKLGGEY